MSLGSRMASLPRRIAGGAREFIDPRLKAGRVPYARTVLALQLAGALIFVGYLLAKKEVALPFAADPYYLEVALPNAAGLDPANEPTVGVAGAPAGRVTDIRYQQGQAIATLRLDSEMEGKVFADATASLRPINVLQVLIVNIDPGDPQSGSLPDGARIGPTRTDTFVAIDELTSLLDADTQAQVQVLISEAAAAFRNREPELRASLAELGELTDTAKPIARALDQRKAMLRKLVDHLDVIFTTLGKRRTQVAEVIDAGSRTLAVTADRGAELSQATRLLAPTLFEAERALAAARRLAEPLGFAFDRITPAASNLQPAASKLVELIPQADEFLGQAELLIDQGTQPIKLFEQGTRGLPQRVTDDLIPAVSKFGETIDALDKYKGGIAQTSDLWSHAFSQNANGGSYSQVYFGNSESTPEGFGFGPSAARSTAAAPSKMATYLAAAFERACKSNPYACVLRFSIPGLPRSPVLDQVEAELGVRP